MATDTPDPLAELRALAAAMRKAPIGVSLGYYGCELETILSRLGEARVETFSYTTDGPLRIDIPHLVIPIKETDRAD